MVCSHCILIPQGSTGNSTFLVSNGSPYFSHYNPQNLSFEFTIIRSLYSRKCTYFLYTNFDFLMYFHNSLIPSDILTFAPGEKIKSNLEVQLCKMCLRVKVNQFRVENTHVKMGTTSLSQSTLVLAIILIKYVVQEYLKLPIL